MRLHVRLSVGCVLSALCLSLLPNPAHAEFYRCEVQDGVEPIEGRFNRTEHTTKWSRTVNPIIVDTDTGSVRFGGEQKASRWAIRKRGSGGNDFVASSNVYNLDNDVGDLLVVRVWAQPVQVLLISNNMALYSGVCSPIR